VRERRIDRGAADAVRTVPVDRERLTAAIVDVPYAIVRRHLLARQSIPASADAIVEDCARALLPRTHGR
jgi:hypothetical protein